MQISHNLIQVNDSIVQTHDAVSTVNKNVVNTSNKISETSLTVALFGGFLLLAIGLLTILKYLSMMLAGIKEDKEKMVAMAPVVNPVDTPAEPFPFVNPMN